MLAPMYQEVPPDVSEAPSSFESVLFQPRLAVTPEATAYEIPASVMSTESDVVPLVPIVSESIPSALVKPALKVISPDTYLIPTLVTLLSATSCSPLVVPPTTTLSPSA